MIRRNALILDIPHAMYCNLYNHSTSHQTTQHRLCSDAELPAEKVKGPHALRAYFLYDAESGRTEYYTVETTPEAGVKKIFRAKPGGGREDVRHRRQKHGISG